MQKENKKIAVEIEVAKQLVHASLPMKLVLQIDDYVENDPYGKHNDSRTAAMTELLKIGLWFAKKRKEFETIFKSPELMEELTSQLSEGGLVDYAERMKWDEFQIVWSIFRNEAKDRKMVG